MCLIVCLGFFEKQLNPDENRGKNPENCTCWVALEESVLQQINRFCVYAKSNEATERGK